ncbi:MAG: type I methionyl aminopeptidase [Alphaproteobacteria bacterium]|nr:type I methionyl aminopeptidase [Alphaproteobacteria bacterium]
MSKKVKIYSLQDFEGMRRAGRLAAETLDYITPFVKPGVTTGYLDQLLEAFMRDNGGIPACIGYNGYPKASCISPNHVICHGIPSDKKILQNGDIINIDITVIVDGWYGDTSRMYYVGKPSVKARRLVETTYATMMAGIEQCLPGKTTGDIGHAMQKLAASENYSVVLDFCGHGIGRVFHDAPNILNYGIPGTGTKLVPGMIFTVEPMVNIGTHQTTILPDGWTAITKDRSLSAQFEHTLGITETGYEIFTLSPKGYTFPPYEGK